MCDSPEFWTGRCLRWVFCAVYLLCQQCLILRNSELDVVFGECFVQSTCCVNGVWYSGILNWTLSSVSVLCSLLAVSRVSDTAEFWTGRCLRRVYCAVYLVSQECLILRLSSASILFSLLAMSTTIFRNSEPEVVVGQCCMQSFCFVNNIWYSGILNWALFWASVLPSTCCVNNVWYFGILNWALS